MLQNDVAPNIGQNLSSNQWPIILGAGLYTACRGERVLAVIRFNASFLPLTHYCEKIRASFLNDADSLTTCGCALSCSQIVYIRPYSLNTTSAFYFATECSDVTVFDWGRVHDTILSYFTWPWPGLDSVSCSGRGVVPMHQVLCYGLAHNNVKKVFVTLLFHLQTR